MSRHPKDNVARLPAVLCLASLLAATATPAIGQEVPPRNLTDAQMASLAALEAQPKGWKDGLTFDGMSPQPWLKNTVNWYPNTETVQPNEMRVTFMGTSPLPRPGQKGTSIYVELGNGDRFVFDMGPGAIVNYLAAGIPLNQINDIFITHLHYDHFASVPYVFAYGGWAGRWNEPLRITGPSGRTREMGTTYMVEKMKGMMAWHQQALETLPTGRGFETEVKEFDFRDDGGVAYQKNGVKITHWRQSHTVDGSSAYRLDWNGLCMLFSGDGRPNGLTAKYGVGCDLVVTEVQPEVVAIAAQVSGALPFIARNTIDIAHNPAYAAGYLYNKLKPRLAMTTHMSYDLYSNPEVYAEIRENWKGPFRFGAPDMVVVNMTKDQIWVRDGVVARYPGAAFPRFDMTTAGGVVVPAPKRKRKDIQEQSVRDAEIPPSAYYPAGYMPEMLPDWPTERPFLIPASQLPPAMKK